MRNVHNALQTMDRCPNAYDGDDVLWDSCCGPTEEFSRYTGPGEALPRV